MSVDNKLHKYVYMTVGTSHPRAPRGEWGGVSTRCEDSVVDVDVHGAGRGRGGARGGRSRPSGGLRRDGGVHEDLVVGEPEGEKGLDLLPLGQGRLDVVGHREVVGAVRGEGRQGLLDVVHKGTDTGGARRGHPAEIRVETLGGGRGRLDNLLTDLDRRNEVGKSEVSLPEVADEAGNGAGEVVESRHEVGGLGVLEDVDRVGPGQGHFLRELTHVEGRERGAGLDGRGAGQEEPVEGTLTVDPGHVILLVGAVGAPPGVASGDRTPRVRLAALATGYAARPTRDLDHRDLRLFRGPLAIGGPDGPRSFRPDGALGLGVTHLLLRVVRATATLRGSACLGVVADVATVETSRRRFRRHRTASGRDDERVCTNDVDTNGLVSKRCR